MKHVKRFANFKALLAFSATCLSPVVNAQPVLPTGSDNYALSGNASQITIVNNASINYGSTMSPGTIGVVVYQDISGSSTKLLALDPGWSGSASITLSGVPNGVTPDVVIGNWDGNSLHCGSCSAVSTDFIVAVAYSIGSIPSLTYEIDYYDLYDDGSTTMTLTLLASTNPFPTYAASDGCIHIDMIAEHNAGSGFMNCSKFAVSYGGEPNGGSAVHMFTAEGNLNSQSSTLTAIDLSNLVSLNNGFLPDVAAVQRPGTHGSIHDVALVTYSYTTSGGAQELCYQSYDFTSSTSSAVSVMDNGSTYISLISPRIDAIDDYSLYSSGTQANYKIATMNHVTGPNYQLRTYDDLMGPGSYWLTSGVVNLSSFTGYSSPPYDFWKPTVAYCGGKYLVSESMEYTANDDAIMMEPIGQTSSTTLYGGNYYWVNNTRAGVSTPPPFVDITSCIGANAVSSPANFPGSSSFFTWAEYNGTTYDIKYKFSFAPSLFSFKQSAQNTSLVAVPGWKIYPNPATEALTIDMQGVSATKYYITDMAGRTVVSGNMTAATTKVDLCNIPAGAYMIEVFNNDEGMGATKFVKK